MRHLTPSFLLVIVAGCVSAPAPTAPTAPAAPSAPAPPSAAEAEPAVEAAEAVEAEAAPESPIDLRRQCDAGGTEACVSLCRQEAAVCDNDLPGYDKDTCTDAAKAVPACPSADAVELGALCAMPAADLAPTQAAVGRFAVDCKARAIAERGKSNLRRYLMRRPVPAVIGPDGRPYITDRHHTSTGVLLADIDEDRKNLYLCPMARRTGADTGDVTAFWSYMKANNFVWPRDRKGAEIPFAELPRDLAGLGDDPYRTLSRWVRDSCGYIKCGTRCGGGDDDPDTSDLPQCRECAKSPYFLEFRWADYLRDAVPIDGIYDLTGKEQADMLRKHLDGASDGQSPSSAMSAAASAEAKDLGLPGWNHGIIPAKVVAFDEAGCDL